MVPRLPFHADLEWFANNQLTARSTLIAFCVTEFPAHDIESTLSWELQTVGDIKDLIVNINH